LRLPQPDRGSLRGAAVVLGVLAVAGWLSVEGHGGHALEALPDILRGAAATIGFLAVTGYAPARLLAPREMQAHLPLLVLPLGAACGSFALTVLGFTSMPFDLALGLVLGGGAAAAVAVRRRLGPLPLVELARSQLLPIFVFAVIAGLTLMPSLRDGALTVPGNNPDAHLVTGAAEVVRHGSPTEIHPELPVDRVSPYWHSKYPIYYSLAASSELSGLDPAEAFPVLEATLLALLAIGVYMLAFYLLRAGPVVSLLAAAFVSLDRVVLYLVVHPYYNQLWGTFALPFMLLFGFRFLREPDRRSAALALLFVALGVFAYPLMLPFPAVALGVAAVLIWRRRRAAGEPVGWIAALGLPDLRARLRARRWVLYPVAAVTALVGLALLAGVVEKGVSAAGVIVPGGDLNGWQGDSPDYPIARYFGLVAVPGLSVLLVGGLAAAAVGALSRIGREERIALITMGAAAAGMALDFHVRRYGEYFEFKTLAFLGPVVLALAVVGLWRLGRKPAGAVLLAALAAMLVGGARKELEGVSAQSPPETFELRAWAGDLPRDASIRLDIPPSGYQLWAAYMLHERPLSATRPVIGTTYPHVRAGRKADYVLVQWLQPKPPDAVGPPVRANSAYRLYRLDPRLPGPDRSSRGRIQPSGSVKG
jgi:hypothetical protein